MSDPITRAIERLAHEQEERIALESGLPAPAVRDLTRHRDVTQLLLQPSPGFPRRLRVLWHHYWQGRQGSRYLWPRLFVKAYTTALDGTLINRAHTGEEPEVAILATAAGFDLLIGGSAIPISQAEAHRLVEVFGRAGLEFQP